MKRLLIVSVLLLLAGCQGVQGPFARPRNPSAWTTRTVHRRAAAARPGPALALPDTSRQAGPRTFFEPPGTGSYGR